MAKFRIKGLPKAQAGSAYKTQDPNPQYSESYVNTMCPEGYTYDPQSGKCVLNAGSSLMSWDESGMTGSEFAKKYKDSELMQAWNELYAGTPYVNNPYPVQWGNKYSHEDWQVQAALDQLNPLEGFVTRLSNTKYAPNYLQRQFYVDPKTGAKKKIYIAPEMTYNDPEFNREYQLWAKAYKDNLKLLEEAGYEPGEILEPTGNYKNINQSDFVPNLDEYYDPKQEVCVGCNTTKGVIPEVAIPETNTQILREQTFRGGEDYWKEFIKRQVDLKSGTGRAADFNDWNFSNVATVTERMVDPTTGRQFAVPTETTEPRVLENIPVPTSKKEWVYSEKLGMYVPVTRAATETTQIPWTDETQGVVEPHSLETGTQIYNPDKQKYGGALQKFTPKAQSGLSYTEWQNLPPELQWDERYRSQLDPNVRALVDPEFQGEMINTGATGYVPIQFTDGKTQIVGDRRGGKKVSDPSQMRAGIEAFPINYQEEWAKAPGTYNQYMQPVEVASKADDFTKQILWKIPEEQRRDVINQLNDLEQVYKSDKGVREAIDKAKFSKDGKFDRSAAYSLLERNPELAQNAIAKLRGQDAQKFGSMQEATGDNAEGWLYKPNLTGIAAIDDIALPIVQAVGRSVTDLYNDPGAVANVPEAYKAYGQYWAPEQFGKRAIDYTSDQEALQGIKAASDLINVLPANAAKGALAAKAWQAGKPLASRAWQTYRPVTDISHLNRYNLKKQLGEPLTQKGSFNEGVFNLRKFPEHVVKIENPAHVGKFQHLPHYPDVNWVEKTSGLPEQFPGIKVQSQLRNVKGVNPESQALIMNKLSGVPIEKMDTDALLNIPITSYRDAYANMLKLRDEALGMDYEGRGNFMYDPDTQQFKFLDYVPHDPLKDVSRNSTFYFWQDHIFGGGNPFIYGKDQSAKNIKKAFENKLKSGMQDASFYDMDAAYATKLLMDRIRMGMELPLKKYGGQLPKAQGGREVWGAEGMNSGAAFFGTTAKQAEEEIGPTVAKSKVSEQKKETEKKKQLEYTYDKYGTRSGVKTDLSFEAANKTIAEQQKEQEDALRQAAMEAESRYRLAPDVAKAAGITDDILYKDGEYNWEAVAKEMAKPEYEQKLIENFKQKEQEAYDAAPWYGRYAHNLSAFLDDPILTGARLMEGKGPLVGQMDWLNDPAKAQELASRFGLTAEDLYEMSGENDSYLNDAFKFINPGHWGTQAGVGIVDASTAFDEGRYLDAVGNLGYAGLNLLDAGILAREANQIGKGTASFLNTARKELVPMTYDLVKFGISAADPLLRNTISRRYDDKAGIAILENLSRLTGKSEDEIADLLRDQVAGKRVDKLNWSSDPEIRQKLKNLGINPDEPFDLPRISFGKSDSGSHFDPLIDNIHFDANQYLQMRAENRLRKFFGDDRAYLSISPGQIADHEAAHWLQGVVDKPLYRERKKLADAKIKEWEIKNKKFKKRESDFFAFRDLKDYKLASDELKLWNDSKSTYQKSIDRRLQRIKEAEEKLIKAKEKGDGQLVELHTDTINYEKAKLISDRSELAWAEEKLTKIQSNLDEAKDKLSNAHDLSELINNEELLEETFKKWEKEFENTTIFNLYNGMTFKPLEALPQSAHTMADKEIQLLRYKDNPEDLKSISELQDYMRWGNEPKAGGKGQYVLAQEPYAHMAEMRKGMIEHGIIKNHAEKITPEKIRQYAQKNPEDRVVRALELMGDGAWHKTQKDHIAKRNLGRLSSIMNRYPAVLPTTGIATGATLLANPWAQESPMPMAYGGPIKAQEGTPFSMDLLNQTAFSENLMSPKKQKITLTETIPVTAPPPTAEAEIDDYLGQPMLKAYNVAKAFAQEGEDPVDNLRHPAAGMYTAQALHEKGLGLAPSIAASGLLGIGHELTTLPPWKDARPWQTKVLEAGEDIFNNFVGAAAYALPMPENARFFALKYLSDNNMLPDGVVMPKGNMYFKEDGGEIMDLSDQEIAELRRQGYIIEEM
jgi:hypothetical protein